MATDVHDVVGEMGDALDGEDDKEREGTMAFLYPFLCRLCP